MTPQHEEHIQQWLMALALRCEPRSNENLEVMVADYVKGLGDLPYEAFSTAAREATTREYERFPSYKSLRAFLEKWWVKNKPSVPFLPSHIAEEPSITEEDKIYLAAWLRRRTRGDFPRGMMVSLSTMRALAPSALAYLSRTDIDVGAIARERGWLP